MKIIKEFILDDKTELDLPNDFKILGLNRIIYENGHDMYGIYYEKGEVILSVLIDPESEMYKYIWRTDYADEELYEDLIYLGAIQLIGESRLSHISIYKEKPYTVA